MADETPNPETQMSATATTTTAAPKLSKELGATQAKDAFWVDPTHVKLGYNSRIHAEADEKQKDLARAYDIFHNGQQQACVARRLEGGDLELVAGFGRLRRVLLIRNGFEYNGEKCQDATRELLVRVDETIKTDEDAFAASIRENVRDEVSPLNQAAQQEVLRKDYGWTDSKIAALYGYNNTNSISRNKTLLSAPDEIKQLVHKGELAVDPAVKLTKLPKAVREEVLASADGKITGPKIVEAIAAYNEKKAAKGETPKGDAKGDAKGGTSDAKGGKQEQAEPTGNAPRNASALKKYLTATLGRDFAGEPLVDTHPTTCKLLQGIVDYLNGVGTEQRLWNRIDAVLTIENAGK